MMRYLPLAVALCLPSFFTSSADERDTPAPKIITNRFRPYGKARAVGDYTFEKKLLARFAAEHPPDEIIALASSSANDLQLDLAGHDVTPRSLLVISFHGRRGRLEQFFSFGKHRHSRALSAAEIDRIRKDVELQLRRLPSLGALRVIDGRPEVVVDGGAHVLVHLRSSGGRRVYINNPPRPSEELRNRSLWHYGQLIDFFRDLACIPQAHR